MYSGFFVDLAKTLRTRQHKNIDDKLHLNAHDLPMHVWQPDLPLGRQVKLQPRSDCCLWKGFVPLWLCKFFSQDVNSWESLLMEGAYLVRMFATETDSLVLPLVYMDEYYNAKVTYMWREKTKVYYKFRIYDLSGYDDAPLFLSILYNLSDRDVSFDSKHAQAIIEAARAKQTERAFHPNRGEKRPHEDNDSAGDRSWKRKKNDGEGQPDNRRVATTEAGSSSVRLGKAAYRKDNIVTKEVQGIELQLMKEFIATKPHNIIHPIDICYKDSVSANVLLPALIILANACDDIVDHAFYSEINEFDEAFLKHMLSMSQDLARGLNFLHTTLSVAHRDIKPASLLLVPGSFTLVITDFDLAVKDEVQVRGMVGTIGYMAPGLYSCFTCFPSMG
ncbi:kinase-like domain-containing protein [Rhodocollybia butyracea]|uniref:Kinase-like domain-containing protein n=1 Tax=Rhodocollybia butyracea TaxID=206335 RepID=A0A9P5Q5S8_9AGAR|nr:kinase-like domain-containing protein [Rhodocollybia butyracea]